MVGEAARALDTVENEMALGHQALLLLRRNSAAAAEAQRRGLLYREAEFMGGFRPWSLWRDIFRLRRFVAANAVDIIHVHRSKEHWLAAVACGHRLPVVRTRHVVMPIRSHIANRWLYTRATAGVICVSLAVAGVFYRSLPFYRGPLGIIAGGVDIERVQTQISTAGQTLRQRLGIPPEAPIFTLLARIDRVKGHLHVVAAMPEILRHEPQAVFLFAYPRQSIYRREVEAAIRRLGLEKHVFWVGELTNIGEALAISTAGIIASVGSEGWSRAAMEFLAAGVPVIGTDVGSIPEIVRHEETGIIVPPADASALAAAAVRLLSDTALCQRMRAACRKAAAFYSLRRMAEETIAFYKSVSAAHCAKLGQQ